MVSQINYRGLQYRVSEIDMVDYGQTCTSDCLLNLKKSLKPQTKFLTLLHESCHLILIEGGLNDFDGCHEKAYAASLIIYQTVMMGDEFEGLFATYTLSKDRTKIINFFFDLLMEELKLYNTQDWTNFSMCLSIGFFFLFKDNPELFDIARQIRKER